MERRDGQRRRNQGQTRNSNNAVPQNESGHAPLMNFSLADMITTRNSRGGGVSRDRDASNNVATPMVQQVSTRNDSKVWQAHDRRQPMPSTTMDSTSTLPKPQIRDSVTNESSSVPRANSRDPIRGNNQSAVQPRVVNPHVEGINHKISEIILRMNKGKVYVSREIVQQEVFNFYHARSWQDIRAHPADLTPLNNLTDRQKSVTFYIQVLEQVFNLCTIHDFHDMLVRFMKVQSYEDLHLGPLHKNPWIERIFHYQPENDDDDSLPPITNGMVIKSFLTFQKSYAGAREDIFRNFLEHFAREQQVQGPENLGVFCRSPPYLIQVSNQLIRDFQHTERRMKNESMNQLIEEARLLNEELRKKILDKNQLVELSKAKTPVDLFNHLISLVEKYFNFLPQQSALYALLVTLRTNDLLVYLLNMSIFLGNISSHETIVNEFKQFYRENHPRENISIDDDRLESEGLLTKKERKKLKAMKTRQDAQRTQMIDDELNNATTFDSTYDHSFHRSSAPPISLNDLCIELRNILIQMNHHLTIEQFLDIEKSICDQHGVNDFTVFNYDGYNDDSPMNLLTFLDRYQTNIDPEGELVIYDEVGSIGEREDIYTFIRQLNILYQNQMNHHGEQQQQVISAHGDLNARVHAIDPAIVSAVEKAVKCKFSQPISTRETKQMMKKALDSYRPHETTILHFEESLFDQNTLINLDLCPSSLLVQHGDLCQIILNAPLLVNLYQWLQWPSFFQPKYGTLKSFIHQNEDNLTKLLLFETSVGELFRLPSDATINRFNEELHGMRIRSAVAYLCAMIVQAGTINQFSFSMYRVSMEGWCRYLRSRATLDGDPFEPLESILNFLMYLPGLLGQKRVIEELILEPIELVFQTESNMIQNIRAKIWELADNRQRSKLELWGYTMNIDDWKNEKKWSGEIEVEDTTVAHKRVVIVTKEVESSAIQQVTKRIEPIGTAGESRTTDSSIAVDETAQDTNRNISTTAFEHIKAIRRKLGDNTDLDVHGQTAVNEITDILKRSLYKISVDLYSEEGHFVLELIQNADDNRYTTNKPTLRFVLSSKRILVCNNEVGFQPENVTAICNVGASTKGQHREGYAGHKGIGFKSVFMVSHRPEVHSQDYHICFDTADGKDHMGYIRPIWLNEYEEVLPDSNIWTTCIRLPIRSDVQNDSLQQKFRNIQAKLLLFLNRLRQIEIMDETNGIDTSTANRIFTRIDHADGQLIELQEKSSNGTITQNLWLVVKKVIEVPESIKEKLRDVKGDIDRTTIGIAYPLNGIEQSSNQLPPAQPLFAYLPLCSYGFRFIMQADFEIPASRQDIRRDNLWNEWLKSEMPQLLYHAYLQFQKLPELLSTLNINTDMYSQLTYIQSIKFFLKLLPSRHELNPYFHSFIDQSLQLLTGVIKLPVLQLDDTDGKESLQWVMPSQCVLVRDPLIRKILSQDLLLSHFNSYYAHEELVAECDEKILLKLGCRVLDFADITHLIEISYQESARDYKKTATSIQEIAQWFICLDYSLQQQREQLVSDTLQKKKMDETIVKLKKMKIIPLKSQSYFTSIEEYEKNTIYLPWEKSKKYAKDLRLILEDVPVIDEQFLSYIEEQHPKRFDSIRKLILRLGVKDTPNIREIYHQQIFPTLMDPKRWTSKSSDLLIAYLVCFYHYFSVEKIGFTDTDFNQFKKAIVVKTRQNQFVSLSIGDTAVHLTTAYGCRRSLESLKCPFHFITDEYITQYREDLFRNDKEKHRFRQFLDEISINEFLQLTFVSTEFRDVSDLKSTPWAYLIDSLSESILDPFEIKDTRCDEFERLLSSQEDPNKKFNMCVDLFRYLNDTYRETAHFYTATIALKRNRFGGYDDSHRGILSSFSVLLRDSCWIPVAGGKLSKPADVYCLPPDDIFRQYVPHIDTTRILSNNSDFIHGILGIQLQVAPKHMFDLLMKWSCNLDSESLRKLIQESGTSSIISCSLPSDHRPKLTDSLENLRLIYKFLVADVSIKNLLSRFREWPLIYIPDSIQSGHFTFAKQVYWQDPINQLSNQDQMTDSSGRIAIGRFYTGDPQLQQLVIDVLQVETQPGIDDYLPLLSKADNLTKSWTLIGIITKLTKEKNLDGELYGKLRDVEFIPTMSAYRPKVKYTDRPFYPHDTKIAELFADDLLIIALPDTLLQPKLKDDFCSLFNTPYLVDVIRIDIDVEGEKVSTVLTNFYRQTIDLIQNFLLEKKWISESRSKELAQLFKRIKFLCVQRIEIFYSYEERIRKKLKGNANTDAYIDASQGKFFILEKFENSEMRYVDAMGHFLVQDTANRSTLIDHIKKLLRVYQDESTEGLNALREKQEQTYEPKWIIPEEVKEKLEVKAKEEEKLEVASNVVVTEEEIEALMSEKSTRPPPKPKDENAKSEPLPAALRTTEPLFRSSMPNGTVTSHTEKIPSEFKDEGDRIPRDHVVPVQQGGTSINDDKYVDPSSRPVIDFTESTIPSSMNFESMIISDLTDIDLTNLGAVPVDILRGPITEEDMITGRQGEELVYSLLKRKHAKNKVIWVNDERESGFPYDIHVSLENGHKEYIEVKSTRTINQHTFSVSIGEIEFLLKNSSNYFIYRVYLQEPIEQSRIIKIHKIDENLKQKNLRLLMTVLSGGSK